MVTQARYLTAFPQVDEEIRVLKEIYGPDYAVPEGMRPGLPDTRPYDHLLGESEGD